ncbi:unnamed protein product [Boreogadus saida]
MSRLAAFSHGTGDPAAVPDSQCSIHSQHRDHHRGGGGESSQALFGILPAGTGESIDPTEPLNLSAELVTLTPVELAFEEPSTSQSPVLEEMWNPPAPPPPCKRKRQAEKGDGYNELLKVETERAQQQIILTNEQIKLTLLKQEEVKLRIQLLEKQLKD